MLTVYFNYIELAILLTFVLEILGSTYAWGIRVKQIIFHIEIFQR